MCLHIVVGVLLVSICDRRRRERRRRRRHPKVALGRMAEPVGKVAQIFVNIARPGLERPWSVVPQKLQRECCGGVGSG